MRRCDRCRFFHPNPPTERPDQIMFTCDGTFGGGECRRQPPVRDDEFDIARFPTVACDWWCGEFTPRRDSLRA